MKIGCFAFITHLFSRRKCRYCHKHIDSQSVSNSFCNSSCELLEICKDIELDTSTHKLVLNI